MSLSRILTICTLSGGLLLPVAAGAADQATPDDSSRAAKKVMNLGNPHEGQTAADDSLEKKLEQKRSEELAEWSERHSREVYPGMGVGGHQPETGKEDEAGK